METTHCWDQDFRAVMASAVTGLIGRLESVTEHEIVQCVAWAAFVTDRMADERKRRREG
jgi:hypothetical protein